MIETILVVDDEKANIDAFVETLGENYDLFVALDGESALEIVDTEYIDLILLDVEMPTMNGYEVCTVLKKNPQTSSIPIIFITANSSDLYIEKAYKVGASDYIVNPFIKVELLSRVSMLLSVASKTKELEKLTSEQQTIIDLAIKKNKLQYQMLLHQSRLAQMGEMISMIAHQWRQPLNAINVTASNLLFKSITGNYNSEIFEKELGLIDSYSQHLGKTIDDFRNFFKEHKTTERTTIKQLVDETLGIVGPSIRNKNIKIIVEDLTCTDTIKTYPNELKQVILNILKNAEDALLESNVENPTITIESRCSKKESCNLIIKDNAGGIDKTIINHIFDPYFSTKKDKEGTGLGLYMSKTIVEEHCEGELNVWNEDDGVVFSINVGDLK